MRARHVNGKFLVDCVGMLMYVHIMAQKPVPKKARKHSASVLRKMRDAAGLTRRDIVERGKISHHTISAHERGLRVPDEASIEEYAAIYSITQDAMRAAITPPTKP